MKSHIGITSAGYFIPDGVMTSREMADLSGIPLSVLTENFGMEQKHVASPDEHPADMGEKAARCAIDKAGIRPADLDIVIFCGAGYYDYQFWSPASRIQYAIGADNAFAFDLKGACNGGNLGIRVCSTLLAADPHLQRGIVICSDRFSPVVDYRRPENLPFFAIGDGASAVVLSKNEPSNSLLGYAGISDGTCVDYVKSAHGGSRSDGIFSDPSDPRFFYVDPAKALADVRPDLFLGNFIRVIRQAVSRSGFDTTGIDRLLTNQIKRTRVLEILENLGLSENKTRFTMRRYGSIGPGDTLLCLAMDLENSTIRPGDLVVLASSGIGFTWGAQVVRFSDP
jgi:3-oxoacyl-[acyl-carrier-protein] synthase III